MKNIKFITLILTILVAITSCSKERNSNLIEGKVKRESTSIASKVPGRILEIRFQTALLSPAKYCWT